MNNIEEGNRLIAKFDNRIKLKKTKVSGYYPDGFEYIGFIGEDIGNVRGVHHLKYHSSWDWLMPVVIKINNLPIEDKCIKSILPFNAFGNCEFLFETKELKKLNGEMKYGFYYNSCFDNEIKDTDNEILKCHKAVVEFIKWHNQNKAV